MDRIGIGTASKDRRRQGEDHDAVEGGERDDNGLDCATVADGLPTYAGKLFEEVNTNSPIAGGHLLGDTFFDGLLGYAYSGEILQLFKDAKAVPFTH